MSTQRLQHALSQVLTRLRQDYEQLDQTIENLEARLVGSTASTPRRMARPAEKKKLQSGGRSSAGWTDDARAAVAARMRAYWQKRREQKAQHHAEASCSGAGTPPPRSVKNPPSRSTAGWTQEARAEAASRMRARWQARRTDMLGHT